MRIDYLFPVLGYLLGSVSSAIVLARLMGLKDPRLIGSGNPGATNILRYGGKTLAALTLLGDVLKGVVPVAVARAFTDEPLVLALTAFGAFMGHLYPVFFRFQGGKGVATAFGVLVALSPWLSLALVATWVLVALISRYSSLSALVTALLAPFYAWWLLPDWPYLLGTAAIAALLIWRHRGNIQRLLGGQEAKIGR